MRSVSIVSIAGYICAFVGGALAVMGILVTVFARVIATWRYGEFYGMGDIQTMMHGAGTFILGVIIWGVGFLILTRTKKVPDHN